MPALRQTTCRRDARLAFVNRRRPKMRASPGSARSQSTDRVFSMGGNRGTVRRELVLGENTSRSPFSQLTSAHSRRRISLGHRSPPYLAKQTIARNPGSEISASTCAVRLASTKKSRFRFTSREHFRPSNGLLGTQRLSIANRKSCLARRIRRSAVAVASPPPPPQIAIFGEPKLIVACFARADQPWWAIAEVDKQTPARLL